MPLDIFMQLLPVSNLGEMENMSFMSMIRQQLSDGHSKRYRHQFTLPEDYLCRVQYRLAKVSSSGSAKIQQAAHILPSSIFFLNLLSPRTAMHN